MAVRPDTSPSYALAAMQDLACMRGRPMLLYLNGPFAHDTTRILYDCLRQMGPQEALDLILRSNGGDPGHARRLGVLLRSFTRQLSILVLDYAGSAASLLCLAADELLMSPLSALSPIDPQVLSALPVSNRDLSPDGRRGQGGPHTISSEEARLFAEMAREWFGVGQSAEENLALLQLVCQRIFPTTLTTFFRADREMRAYADELLRFHQDDEELRRRIGDRFISRFSSHSHLIHREEARELGLPVRNPTPEEEACLWWLQCWSRDVLGSVQSDPAEPGQLLSLQAALAGPGFTYQYGEPVSAPAQEAQEKNSQPIGKPDWRAFPFAAFSNAPPSARA